MRSSQVVRTQLIKTIHERFGVELGVPDELPHVHELMRILEHRSHRRYVERPVDESLLRLLFACEIGRAHV